MNNLIPKTMVVLGAIILFGGVVFVYANDFNTETIMTAGTTYVMGTALILYGLYRYNLNNVLDEDREMGSLSFMGFGGYLVSHLFKDEEN